MSKQMWTYVAVGTFILFATGVITALVLGKTYHTEGGFLEGCWRADNAFEFDVSKCDAHTVVEPEWGFDNLPIRVSVVSIGSNSTDGVGITERAVDDLNTKLGFKLLRYVTESSNVEVPDIAVYWDAAYIVGKSSPAGTCSFRRQVGEGYRGAVRVRGQHSIGAYAHVIMHELGHCALMLEHDDFSSSLMTEHKQKHVDTPGFHGQLTDHDVALIRKRYRRD